MTTQEELNTLIRKLRKIEPTVTRQIKGDLRQAAQPIIVAIKAKAPVGTRTHKRGAIVYKPGNLRKSIKVLPLRRTRNAVIVGPQARGGTPDGYYARFIEFGTRKLSARPFVDPAVQVSFPTAEIIALELLKNRIEAYEKQNAV
jgi:HK97 gp10 family phage protein